MTTDVLAGLNPMQREAAEAIDGPLLIVAGPGSGKTRVITHRIAYLVRTVGVSPHRIAAVTFTNKAAREMRQRLIPMLGHSVQDLTVSTFHSLCARVLRIDGRHIGLDSNFAVYDDSDQISLVKRCLKELEIDPKRFPPRGILSAISGAKSQLLGVEGFALRAESYYDEVVRRVYELYEGLLRQASAVDFDDLLLKAHFLLDKFPEVAKKYQDRYVHFMIDEFQDTNVAQYALARQMADGYRNICVVGDPDQSIYTWRNADIRNILSFRDDYPQAKIIPLEENYRSTQTILDAAQSLIASNTQRVEKGLWTRNGQGVPIVISEGYNEQEEAQSVVKEVQALARTGDYELGDIAVMYRVNAQSRVLEESCLRYGVPYQVVGGLKFYQRQEVKDVTAYLRLVSNPDDDVSLTRVINLPTRGIGQRTLDELARRARDAGVSMFAAIGLEGESARPLAPRSARALADFRALIEGLIAERDRVDLLELIDLVLERTGYQRHLVEGDERGEERLENIQELRSSARDFLQFGVSEALTAFLESVSLVADVDEMEERADAVTLITLHQAKGLEFPVVFIVGMEEGVLPHLRSMDDPTALEEERRLCYVGFTRAKERLYLLRAFRRGFRGGSEPSTPSRFLVDVPPQLLVSPSGASLSSERPAQAPAPRRRTAIRQSAAVSTSNGVRGPRPARPGPETSAAVPGLSAGDKVRHAKFGEGIVTAAKASGADYEVTVAFKDGAGVKRLLLSFAKLEKVE